ncbi:similar to Saccharomyces cerevisiae YHR166C CDC23 Subunit of the Anaphase-Promoting Complex/Cyclosome (APC/C) [Maudiozyma barnettii]|uniref:Similar to Saccharomyces cerevisiae YHR166C CDC23 Subunit of the Anaphase-Promoting Complex/Cyclosome (APC/C) n=1 Tax=Maudiozyma barnettii TaxID=61262 RepID=A0A8H2ZGR4_9SACH|nr:anaphase promoting complex subunit CDC23 [Kazachstania barnettii]CAB4254874.1 similar to Saccharomyces cerevisiae YHR166C CDC23 Subunit of the Anaphase-Promoting Complex/Cyclosome (APC/C) [Kazachstania barnettii]CAD1783109.1 similar to Saccharomyces cerevisiae YHR166C CDC23 Subunit of the Anaphase-Promoting Complex/Cyclosome (APC/C) [Kazachstania barnettii]
MNGTARRYMIQDVKDSLRNSSIHLSQWKLLKSAKWSIEALRGMEDIPLDSGDMNEDNMMDANSSNNHANTIFNEHKRGGIPKMNEGFTEDEFDKYLLASSLFDCKEFDRCVYFLANVDEPRLMFLKLYCKYLSWDKKTVESVENVLVTGKARDSNHCNDNSELGRDNEQNSETSGFTSYLKSKKNSGIQHMEDGHQSSVALILKELRNYLNKNEADLLHSKEGALGVALLYYLKGVLLNQNGNKPQALTAYVTSLSLYSFNWTCWVELLDCISRPDESLLILKHLNEQFDLSEQNHYGTQRINTENIMLKFFKLSLFQEFSGNIDEFLGNLELLLTITPNFAYLKAQNALVYYNHMDYSNSESIFDQIIKLDPYRLEDLDIYSNILYVMQKQSKLAYLAQFVSQIDRFRPETCCIIANYYSARQEHEKSIMYFRRALILNKKSTSAWTLMGHEFVELKNSHAAVECYRRAVDINNRDFRAWYGLGQAYEVLDMHMYSLYYFQKACALKPLDRRMWQATAECYAKLKYSNGAIKCYLRALQLSTIPDQESLLFYKLAEQYEETAELDRCKSYMIKCMELERSNEGLVTDEAIKAKLWLAKNEFQNKNYEEAYNYAISITNGTSQEVEEARTIARNCRLLLK